DFASRVFSRVAGELKRVHISAQGLRRAFLTVIASGAGLVFVFKKIFDAGAGVLETQSKFNTVFGESAERMEAFNKEFARTAGLTETVGQGLLATTASIIQGLGFSTEASADFSEAVLRLAGDLASFNNIPTAETTRAIQAALTGEREQLKRLGIVLLDVDVKTRALELSRKTSAAALTNQEKATASLQLIMERAGKAVRDLNRTQDSAENTAKRVKAAFADQFNQFSTDLIPVLQDLLPLFEELAGKAEAATARVAGFITTLFDLAGLTNATLREELARFATLPEGQLPGRAKDLREEIAGKRAQIAKPERFGDLGFFEIFQGKTKERKELIEETDNLQIALDFLETRIARLKDTSEGTADSVERVVNALKGGPGGPAAPDFPTTQRLQFGLRPSPFLHSRLRRASRQPPGSPFFRNELTETLRQEAKRLADEAENAAQGLDVLGQSVVTNFSQMAAAALSGSQQMEQIVISAFTNILSSIKGVSPFGGALIGAIGGLFGGLFGGRKDPVPVRIAKVDPGAVQDLQTGPSKVILQLIQDGVTIEEIEYELWRRQRTDQKVRIPRGVKF
ncbi:hypothetical protein LCGC14_1676330, partial [marine sediment metagenome]